MLPCDRARCRPGNVEAVSTDGDHDPDSAAHGQALAEIRRQFQIAAATMQARAPLYSRLATGAVEDPMISRLLLSAPPGQRLPVLLFACVHWVLINEPDHDLRRYYPNLVDEPARDDPSPAFRQFCLDHEARLRELLQSRTTQTNEVGRCAILMPPLALVERETDGPIALLDIGTSAGLTLGLDRYQYRYDPGGTIGASSRVLISCGTRGDVPLPAVPPRITARIGLDRSPVDLTDLDARTWLEACVWPDQPDRFHRLSEAIHVALDHPVDVRVGDAVTDLADTVSELSELGHPVVTNTWVLNYLVPASRLAYIEHLEELGGKMDLTWVFAESPALAPELPIDHQPSNQELTHLVMVRWRGGRRTDHHLAVTHPHGYWMQWD
jgi:hypothetical protein